MKSIPHLLTVTALFALSACQGGSENSSDASSSNEATPTVSEQTMTYRGILPCGEGCNGAIAEVELGSNQSIALRWMYLGDSEDYQNLEGTYTKNETGNRISSEIGGETFLFALDGNTLTKLNDEGEFYEGEDAALYNMMLETEAEIANRLWQFKSVGDQAIENTPKEAFIIFDNMLHAYGNNGCNFMNGSYTLMNQEINIAPLATTLMLCQGVEYESALGSALEEVDNFTIANGMLYLNKGGSTLITLEEEEIKR